MKFQKGSFNQLCLEYFSSRTQKGGCEWWNKKLVPREHGCVFFSPILSLFAFLISSGHQRETEKDGSHSQISGSQESLPASSHNSKDKDKNRAKDNNKDREKDKEKYIWLPRVFGPPIVSHNSKDKEYKKKTNIITRKKDFQGKRQIMRY